MSDRLSLHIGNNYPGTDAELAGCVNDAHDWADLAVAQGYSPATVLECDKQTAIELLKECVSRLGWGDRFLFTYSGHGSWVRDRDADESDGRDECLVMTDYLNGGLLTDDELYEITSQRKAGSSVLIVSDSCHSGTMSRFLGDSYVPTGARFLSPAYFTDMTKEEAFAAEERVGTTTPRLSSSLISGCMDKEFSYDAWFGSRANGAFTRAAIDTFTSGISLNSWHQKIRTVLPNSDYPQTPQLTAQSTYRKYTKAL